MSLSGLFVFVCPQKGVGDQRQKERVSCVMRDGENAGLEISVQKQKRVEALLSALALALALLLVLLF